jgi:peptide-methionine (S)-S-oxide reductase
MNLFPSLTLSTLLALLGLAACGQTKPNAQKIMQTQEKTPIVQTSVNKDGLETATFGAGCFWCVEAVFQQLEGVKTVVSGYTGGKVENPTYKQVSAGTTGHAEVIQLTYDPKVVTFPELLEVFWQTHDPTTLNRQGADVGTQYRSAVFYHTPEQKTLAEQYKRELDAAGAFNSPIVTEIVPVGNFYKAEDYHQNYYNLNSSQPYCSYVITPKLEKLKKVFKDKLKAAK